MRRVENARALLNVELTRGKEGWEEVKMGLFSRRIRKKRLLQE